MSLPWDKDKVYPIGSVVSYNNYEYTFVGSDNALLPNQNPATSTFTDNYGINGSQTRRCWLPQAVRQGDPNITQNLEYGHYLPDHLQFVRGAGPSLDSNIAQGGPPNPPYQRTKGVFQYVRAIQVTSYFSDGNTTTIGDAGIRNKSWFNLTWPGQRDGPFDPNGGMDYEYNKNEGYTLSSDYRTTSGDVATVPTAVYKNIIVYSATVTEIKINVMAGPGVPPSSGYVRGAMAEIPAFIGFMSTFDKTLSYEIKYSERVRLTTLDPWGPWVNKLYQSTINTGVDITEGTASTSEFKQVANGTTKQLRLDSYGFTEMQTPMLFL